MEICQCERYKDIVEKTNFFSLGTLNPLLPRIPVPQNACIAWKSNRANHDDQRPNKPTLITQSPNIDEKKDILEPIESKWIPILPGVISQKSVNESKRLDSLF